MHMVLQQNSKPANPLRFAVDAWCRCTTLAGPPRLARYLRPPLAPFLIALPGTAQRFVSSNPWATLALDLPGRIRQHQHAQQLGGPTLSRKLGQLGRWDAADQVLKGGSGAVLQPSGSRKRLTAELVPRVVCDRMHRQAHTWKRTLERLAHAGETSTDGQGGPTQTPSLRTPSTDHDLVEKGPAYLLQCGDGELWMGRAKPGGNLVQTGCQLPGLMLGAPHSLPAEARSTPQWCGHEVVFL